MSAMTGGPVRQLLTCRWTARRLQRYLDADPAAPLAPGEVTRLEEHLSTCARCGEVVGQHRRLRRALAGWSARQPVEAGSLDRLRTVLDDLVDGRRS